MSKLFIDHDSAGDLYVWRQGDIGEPKPVLNFLDVTDEELTNAITEYVARKRADS